MLRISILFFLCFFIDSSIHAQSKEIDSLKRILQSNTHDTTRLLALSDMLNYAPMKDCEAINDQMLVLSSSVLKKEYKNQKITQTCLPIQAEAFYNKAVFLSDRSKNDSALIFYEKAIPILQKVKNEEMLAYTYIGLSTVFRRKADMAKAIDFLYKALAIHEKKKDFEGMGTVYTFIAHIYFSQQEYQDAFLYTNKALETYRKIHYVPGMIDALYNLGIICINTLNENPDKKIVQDIQQYYYECIKLAKSINNQRKNYDKIINNCYGFISYYNNKTDSCIYYFEKGLLAANKNQEIYSVGPIYLGLCAAYYKSKNYQKAILYGQKALKIAQDSKNIMIQLRSFEQLLRSYKEIQDFKQAFLMQEMYWKLNDSLRNINQKKAVLKQELKYDFEKKQDLDRYKNEEKIRIISQNAEKANFKKNVEILALIILLMVMGGALFFVYKYQKQKTIIEKQQKNLFKQRLLLSQMNPHFIFNAINSIQSFILKKNEKDAYSYLTKFSKLIRAILNNSLKDKISLNEEIELIQTYIEIEQLRFDDAFSLILDISENIDTDEISVPPMIIQPYIENAIWHGLMNLNHERKGELVLKFSIKDHFLKVIVEDNGIGRELAKSYKVNHYKPIAMNLTQERLEMLHSGDKKEHIHVEIEDLYNSSHQASGTCVTIYLPLHYQFKDEYE